MKLHLPPHKLAILALAMMILTFLIIKLAPQMAVDLRPSVIPAPVRAPLPRENYAPQYDLLALRSVLGDLASNVQLLQTETGNYMKDADALWNTWKNYFGVRGGMMDWTWFYNQPPKGTDQARLERLQSEIFRLDSRAQQLKHDTDDLSNRLQQADARWGEIRDSVLAERADERSVILFQPRIVELRAALSRLAVRLNALDGDIQNREDDMDDIYPRFEKIFQEQFSNPPPMGRPWHWNNMLSSQSRLSLKYDFDNQYADALDKARSGFSAPRRIAPKPR